MDVGGIMGLSAALVTGSAECATRLSQHRAVSCE